MSLQKVSATVPPLRPVPPGAAWLVSAVPWLFGGDPQIRAGLSAWLEAIRARLAIGRAARRDARSRAELVSLARRYQATQPEFAKDLFAAAQNGRHA